MEIRDPVHGNLEITPPEVEVLDSSACQRLRFIKQLGFAEFSFPGATHNRYIHSLGAQHLAGMAFDSIFRGFAFSKPEIRYRLRQAVRLGALLHDIGHGPLSHVTEEVMPPLKDLNIKIYDSKPKMPGLLIGDNSQQASHEDFTIKFLTDSALSQVLRTQFADMKPEHIACLVDRSLPGADDFFIDKGVDFRIILSQIVSSELDVDRMDYLERDAYFCGTNYGRVELSWLVSNLTYHIYQDKMHLALNRRALHTFDDFLLARHHMHLMVYFHHKSIIFEEMLLRYLSSEECSFRLPADIDKYTRFTDHSLFEHLAQVSNTWARRISERRPFRVIFEIHATDETPRPELIKQALNENGIEVIHASSKTRLSKYHSSFEATQSVPIFVVDQYDRFEQPIPIEECTEIFKKYEETRRIERLYVAPEQYAQAQELLLAKRL